MSVVEPDIDDPDVITLLRTDTVTDVSQADALLELSDLP